MNPEDKVREILLPDVLSDLSFTKVATTDRCASCHVHIDRKEFTEERVLGYLEEQLSSGQQVRFSPPRKADDPTEMSPGASAMPEFWHLWGFKLLAANQQKANVARVNNILAVVGEPGITVTYNGRPRQKFTYDPAAANADEQNAIVVAVIDALYKYEKPRSAGQKVAARSEMNGAVVEIAASFDDSKAAAARDEAFAYPMDVRKAIVAGILPGELNLLEERYRHVLVDKVNVFREARGFDALDASPAQLAHPRLDLYCDADSAHAMEAVGCTSCHDGSGQETDFVLAAHSARDIWVDKLTGIPVLPQQIDVGPAVPDGNVRHSRTYAAEHHAADMSDMRETVLNGDATALHLDHLAPHDAKKHNGHGAASEPASHPTPAPTTAPAEVARMPLGTVHEAKAPHATMESEPLQYKDPLTGQVRTAVAQIQYWAAKYEHESGTYFATVYHEWDWPMRTPEFIQANCARCHTGIHEIRKEAPVLYEGRTLFAKLGCANCHQMDSIPAEDKRQVGPDLRHVNAKLSNAFLDSWIWAPKAFRPSTMMPHFFMLENSSSDEELRRTQQEVRAIRTYLTKTATPLPESDYLKDPANKMPEGEGDVDRGRSLFIGFDPEKAPIGDMQGGVGCVGCHTNLNETGQKWITNDMVKGGVLEDYLSEFGKKTAAEKGKAPTARELQTEAGREALRRYRAMSYNERQLYAMEHFAEALGASSIPKYADGTPKPVFQHHGPELSGVGTKLMSGRSKEQARKWLYSWLIDPRHYSSYTVMPRLRLSPQDALDLAEYLLAQKRQQAKAGDDPWKAKEIAPDNDKVSELVAFFLLSKYPAEDAVKHAIDEKELADLAAISLTNKTTTSADAKKMAEAMPLEEKQLIFLGQKLINHYGCMNCHAINGMEGAASPCANLSDWGQKSVDKLDYGYLTHHKIPELPKEGSRIPMVNGLSVAAVTQITEALNGKKWDEPLAKDVQVGWPHIDHTRQSWLAHKLKNSRIYDRGKNLIEPVRTIENGQPVIISRGKPYDKLRMPTFYLNDEQVHALVTFVISNKDRLVTPRLLEKVNNEEMKQIARGRQIAEKYNCVGCHQIDANTPPVQQYWLFANFFPKDEMTAKAPPSLRSEGARIQHSWVFNFIKHVDDEGTVQPEGTTQRRRMRPQPFIRMPSFPITDEDATAIAAYFNAVSVHEAKGLAKRLDGLLKDAAKGKEGAPATQPVDPNEVWPPDDWFAGNARGESKYAAMAADLKTWALENTLAKPSDFAPDAGQESIERAYKSALFDARIVAKSFVGSYPFAELARPTPSKERFAAGEKLYHLMQCQTCHVIGNDAAEGVNKQPKGPNLSMTSRRLQRKWVRHWVQEPQTIQPGNPMAAIFFSGRGIQAITDPNKYVFALNGLPYIPSDRNAESIRSVQYEFGDTVDAQTDLVIDFIYAAGFEGYTSKDPPQGEPKLAAAPKDAKLALLPGFTAPLPEPAVAKGPTSRPTTPVAGQGAVAANAGPSITGKVLFVGAPPPRKPMPIGAVPQCANHPALGGKPLLDETLIVGKGGELKNAVVSIKNPPPGRHPIPSQPAVLDQIACHYSPHVLAMMTGQPLVIKNSDPFLHNVHGLPELNLGFNFAQNNIDPGRPVPPMTQAEEFRVKCDVHGWMNCHFVVFNHPFFAVTGDDGTYTISGLPPGTYTVTVWHEIETLRSEQQITVPAGKAAEANFSVKME